MSRSRVCAARSGATRPTPRRSSASSRSARRPAAVRHRRPRISDLVGAGDHRDRDRRSVCGQRDQRCRAARACAAQRARTPRAGRRRGAGRGRPAPARAAPVRDPAPGARAGDGHRLRRRHGRARLRGGARGLVGGLGRRCRDSRCGWVDPARQLAARARCPDAEILLTGAADGFANIHAPNERVLLDEFENSVLAEADFFARYAARVAG